MDGDTLNAFWLLALCAFGLIVIAAAAFIEQNPAARRFWDRLVDRVSR